MKAGAWCVLATSLWASDLSLEFQSPTVTVTAHEPVVARLVLRNWRPVKAVVDFGGDFKRELRVTITEPGGHARRMDPLPIKEGMEVGGIVNVSPAGTHIQQVFLNEWHPFRTPGTYAVEVRFPEIEEPALLTVRVLPREPNQLRKVCDELASQAVRAKSFDDALASARALSFAVDPEAVPYLARIAKASDNLITSAIDGLVRIGDRTAALALIDLVATGSGDLPVHARGGLGFIRIATKDPVLKSEIEEWERVRR